MLLYRYHKFELVSFPLHLRIFDRFFSVFSLRFRSSVSVFTDDRESNMLVLKLKEVSLF